jgi:hypothetical protein
VGVRKSTKRTLALPKNIKEKKKGLCLVIMTVVDIYCEERNMWIMLNKIVDNDNDNARK